MNKIYLLFIALCTPLSTLAGGDPNAWEHFRNPRAGALHAVRGAGAERPALDQPKKQTLYALALADLESKASKVHAALNIDCGQGPAAKKEMAFPGKLKTWQLAAAGYWSDDKTVLAMYETLRKAQEHFNIGQALWHRIDGESFFVINVDSSHSKETVSRWYMPKLSQSPISGVLTEGEFERKKAELAHRNHVRTTASLGVAAFLRSIPICSPHASCTLTCCFQPSTDTLGCYCMLCPSLKISHHKADDAETRLQKKAILAHLVKGNPEAPCGNEIHCVDKTGFGCCICVSGLPFLHRLHHSTIEDLAQRFPPYALEMKRD